MRGDIKCLALMVVALLLGCGGDSDRKGCRHDNDCKDDRICEDRVCIDPSSLGDSPDAAGGQGGMSDAGLRTEQAGSSGSSVGGGGMSGGGGAGSGGMSGGGGAGSGGAGSGGAGGSFPGQMDAGGADGSGSGTLLPPFDEVFSFPTGACPAGFNCVSQLTSSIIPIMGDLSLCVRPGESSPPTCERDEDCAALGVGCYDLAEAVSNSLGVSVGAFLGLNMNWCALQCDGYGTVDGGDDADSGVGAGELCTNTCRFASDGDCDDCGPGSDYSLCDIGTDCADCGPRSIDATCAP